MDHTDSTDTTRVGSNGTRVLGDAMRFIASLPVRVGRFYRGLVPGRPALFGVFVCLGMALCASEPVPNTSPYREGTPSSPDGTGRFYQGREIAHVMSHQGAWWLERTEREGEERPDAAVAALGLKPGMTVADLGAGTGYYSRRIAREVGPAGRVYAVDVQPEMLALLRQKAGAAGLTNIVTVQATEQDPKLPVGAIDLVVMVDVYHELAWPHEVMQALLASLRPGGRIAFLEYRAEDPKVPIKPLHKMTEAQVRKEAELHGLEWIETVRSLPWQHLILFRKPAPPNS